MERDPSEPTGGERPIIFFDGVCNLCNGFVRFVLRHERRPVHLFVTLQGETAARRLSSSLNASGDLQDSIFLYKEGKLVIKSAAFIEIAGGLEGYWRLARIALVVPRFLRDGIYDFVARNRYVWFGRTDQCMVPTPDIEARFLS